MMRSAILFTALGLVACVKDPVDWGDVSYRHSQLGDLPARSAVMSAGLPQIPGTVASCVRTVVPANSHAEIFRAWWAVRSDSNGVLFLQRSPDDGKSWQTPVEVDARDEGHRGCSRLPPGISYDSASRYVYLVYFLDATDGAGVLFDHSIDEGKMFHSPVQCDYASSPSQPNVAGHGDCVIVVFEDAHSHHPTLSLVLPSSA